MEYKLNGIHSRGFDIALYHCTYSRISTSSDYCYSNVSKSAKYKYKSYARYTDKPLGLVNEVTTVNL